MARGRPVPRPRHRPRRIRYRPIERWLAEKFEEVDRGTLSPLDYARTVRIYADAFGIANVGVFPLEHLREDPAGYGRELCRFLGIDAAPAWRLLPGPKANLRVSQATMERIRRVARSPVRSRVVGLMTRRHRERFFGIVEEACDAPPRARAPIPDGWRARIADYTRPGNRDLAARWDLPLDRLGYPSRDPGEFTQSTCGLSPGSTPIR